MQIVATINTPLLDLMHQMMPDCSMTTLRSWIKQGRVLVSLLICRRAGHLVQKGDEVKLRPRMKFSESGLKILYEDSHIVIVEKPMHLLSVATDAQAEKTVHSILKRHAKKMVWPVHRLDRDTSGVMVFAYSDKARDKLKAMFEAHDLDRQYYALVEGIIKEPKGTWKSFLKEDINYMMKSAPEGKWAVTHIEVIKRFEKRNFTRICCTLETGRKNQIRVQSSDALHPIVGDKKYRATTNPFRRLCLHAHLLRFKHPVTGKEISFTSPVPSFFFTGNSSARVREKRIEKEKDSKRRAPTYKRLNAAPR